MPKFPPSTRAVDWESLPFSSEDISESAGRIRDESALNFTRLNVRRWVQESARPRKRFKEDLRKMLELPEELIMEILSHTHPIDLHAFRVVNRSFRAFLSSPASNTVWKMSFQKSSQSGSSGSTAIPTCPEDMNGWEWASLLFGAPVCDRHGQYCGDNTPYVYPDPSPVIRKRLCMTCFEARTTRIHDAPSDVVQRLSVVDGLVLETLYQHSIPQRDYIPDYLINSDFETVLAEYTQLQGNGDDVELERYKEGRRRYVDTHTKHVHECNRWLIDMGDRFWHELQTKFDDRLKRIMKHLRHEGFPEIDISTSRRRWRDRLEYLLDEECFSDPYHGGGTFNERLIRWSTLTRANWQKIREPYCDLIRRFARTRLQTEREEFVRQVVHDYRHEETSDVNDASEQPRPPSQSPPANALAIDFASAYSDSKDPSRSRLQEAFEQKKTLVLSVLGLQLSYTVWSARTQVFQLLNEPSLGVDPLELAVSLIVRKTYQDSTDPGGGATPLLHRLTGWEAVASNLDLFLQTFQEGDHHPDAFETMFFPVDPIPAMRQLAFRTVCALLHVLDLDPRAALAKDLDDRDDRFVCLSCGGSDSGSDLPGKEGISNSGRERSWREAHSWREAVRSLRPRWRSTRTDV
ncbi:hypothetical protein PQX77_013807 [Marasmius sp. AFHP31]|nr:hypothetical protein PQX77_013807 [Marasmius sp. AFHP31]